MQLLKTFVIIALAVTGLAQSDSKHPGGCPNADTCKGRCTVLGYNGGVCGGEGNAVCTCN